MTLKSDVKFTEKMTMVPKMTLRIWWILMQAVAGMEVCALMYYFCWKYIMFEP